MLSQNDRCLVNARVRLEQMVTERLSRIDAGARRILELIAVSGRPGPANILADASKVDDRLDEIVGLLRERRFVHAGVRDGREVIETSHDRIRETIVAQLPSATLRAHHGLLAGALESVADPDVAAVVVHPRG